MKYISRLPWNQKTLVGRFWEILYGTAVGICYNPSNFGALLFFIAIGEFLKAIQLNFERMTTKMDKILSARPELDTKSFLCDLIRYHIKAKGYESNQTKNRKNLASNMFPLSVHSRTQPIFMNMPF